MQIFFILGAPLKRGLRPQAPDAFRLNPQPHYLASESGSQKSEIPSSLLNTKLTIFQKLKTAQKKLNA